MRRILVASALAFCAASPALAQSEANASDASGATSIAIGAIGESGLKASAGVVAVPLGVAGTGSVVAGMGASEAGSNAVGIGAGGAGLVLLGAAGMSADFAREPLKIGKQVVVGPPPQAAPNVSYVPVPVPAKAPGQ